MADPMMESLARRLDRLERENRRLRVVGLLALGAVLAMLAALAWPNGRVTADEVVAGTLTIRDSSTGAVVASLESSLGGGEVRLRTTDHRSLVVVSARPEGRGGPMVVLHAPPAPNTNGPATASLSIFDDGRPRLYLDSGDESATLRIRGGVNPPELLIESRDGRRFAVSP